jgi:hypothetical protein
MFRFDFRQAPIGFAVWDSTVAGWYSEWSLSEAEASEQATELDVLHGFYADREPADVRRLELPRLVEAQPGWRPAGVLDVWLRDDGAWWGRVRDDRGVFRWHRATVVRPASTHLDR